MKWTLANTTGACAWIIGLFVAKGSNPSALNVFADGDHHFVIGLCVGLAGLAMLLWTNLVSTS